MTQAFNLSQFANKVNTSGQADLTTAVTGTLPVANGGTGATTLTSGNVLIGAGTSAVTSVAAGTAGNVLTSNGTTWTSGAASGGQYRIQIFTSPGTWTRPGSVTNARVYVIGGGGGATINTPGAAGVGGIADAFITTLSGPVAVTVGSGGAGAFTGTAASGGTSSFGSFLSATGGSGSTFGSPTPGSAGTGTVSTGTTIKTISVTGPSATNYGVLRGTSSNNPYLNGPGAIAYSVTGVNMAGTGGQPAPQPSSSNGGGGVGGAVVIEFVG
jgi:hypothetical protein